MRRTAPTLIVALAAAALLSGCNSHTSKCTGSTCEVSISSSSGDYTVELDDFSNGADTDLTLVSAQAGGDFRFRVDGTDYTCRQGDAVDVAGTELTCTKVEDNSVELRYSPS